MWIGETERRNFVVYCLCAIKKMEVVGGDKKTARRESASDEGCIVIVIPGTRVGTHAALSISQS